MLQTEDQKFIWEVGQLVEVQPRTWAGINRLGGHGKITKVHMDEAGNVESLDVKYTISGGADTHLDPDLVKNYVELDRKCRSRRGRPPPTVPADKGNNQGQKENNINNNKNRPKHSKSKPRRPQAPQPPAGNVQKPGKAKRTLGLQILRPKKKSTKLAKKSKLPPQTTDQTLDGSIASASVALPDGLPCEIEFSQEANTFLSPLETKPKVDSMLDSMSPDPDYDKPSDASIGSNFTSRSKPLFSANIPGSESNSRLETEKQDTKLEKLHKNNQNMAKKFVQEVVKHTTKKETSPQTNVPTQELTAKESVFRKVVFGILRENDGYLAEDDFVEQIRRAASTEPSKPSFTQAELGLYTDSLISEDRVMRSEGMIIAI